MRRGSLGVVFALVCASLFGLWAPSPAAAEPSFPPGFTALPIETGQGEWNLTDFAFVPNGALLAVGKNGRVNRVDANGAITTVANIPVATNGDVGLLGISLAHDYAHTGHVYAVYNYQPAEKVWVARLSRFTVDNPAAPSSFVSEAVVLDGIDHSLPGHTIGTVIAAPDGTLWMGMGDGGSGAHKAQDLNLPHGKILRVNPNGTGVQTNPFYDAAAPTSWKSRIWAYGVRNPFRFSLHPDGTPYIGDVGNAVWEEVNIGVAGGNYGWPCWEGTNKHADQLPACQALYANGGDIKPLWQYGDRGPGGLSVTGGDFAWGDAYPEPYANSWFFAEWVERKVWTMETNALHQMTRAPEPAADRANGAFGADAGYIVALRRSPAGEIYYADISSGQVFRIRYTGGNRPPTVRANVETTYNNPTAKLFASTSSDPDGDSLSFRWDFGDGTHSFQADPVHTYPTAGKYTAKVTVSDNKGGISEKSLAVIMDDREPTLLVNRPAQDTFAVGDPVTATAAATDAEDADLGPEDVTWRVSLNHCNSPSHCHTHPGASSTGPQFAVPFPDHGPDMSMVVTAEVVDSVGHVATTSFEVKPRVRTLTVTSQAGAPIFVNNDAAPAGGEVRLVANSANTLWALDAHNKTFSSWSDNPANTSPARPFTMPAVDTSVIAQFRDVSLNVAVGRQAPDAPLVATVTANGQQGDKFRGVVMNGCTGGPPAAGDNDHDWALAVGETWTIPCDPTMPVAYPTHTVTAAASTANAGWVSGATEVPVGIGYRMVATDGGVFSFGEAPFRGSMGGATLNETIVSMTQTATGNGYWMVAADGGVFSFGDARFFGSKGGQPLPAPIVAMAATRNGQGYWLAAGNGSVYPFGDAASYGSLEGVPLAAPIVAMTPTASGNGYWLVASDGGVFSFGDAAFLGSMGGQRLNQPIVGMAATPSGKGYWQVALDGGIFAFGDAVFYGSMGGQRLNEPITGMTLAPSGVGYWLVATDGGIFAFGDAPFYGSMGGTRLNEPVAGISSAVVAKL